VLLEVQGQKGGKDWGESKKYFRADTQETKKNRMTRETKEVTELTAWGQSSQQGKPGKQEGGSQVAPFGR